MEINKEYLQAIALMIVMMVDISVYEDVTHCPVSGKGLRSASKRLGCNKTYIYHCLLDNHEELIEKCLLFKWMRNGSCPIFITNANNGRGDLHQTSCLGKQREERCPPAGLYRYKSSEVFKYRNCFRKQERFINVNMESSTIQSLNETVQSYTSFGNYQIEQVGPNYTSVVSSLAAVFLFLMFVLAAVYLYYKRRYVKRKAVVKEERERLYINTENSYNSTSIIPLGAYKSGIRIIEETGILIITGRMGSGKTTAMEYIIKAITEKSDEWIVKKFSFKDKHDSYTDRKYILVMDDCFGKFVVNPANEEETMKMIQVLLSWMESNKGKSRLILCMSENEFLEIFTPSSNPSRCVIENYRLCLDKLETIEKDAIFDCMFNDPRFEISKKNTLKKKLKEIDKQSVAFAALGWPLICRLISIPEMALDMDAFSKNPLQCLFGALEKLKTSDDQLFCAMVYAVFKGGDISKIQPWKGDDNVRFRRVISEEFSPSMMPPPTVYSDPKFRNNINNTSMSKSEEFQFIRLKLSRNYVNAPHYFVRKESEVFHFHHKIFELALLYYLYKMHPFLMIHNLEVDLLMELFRPKGYEVKDNELDITYLFDFDGLQDISTKDTAMKLLYNRKEENVPTWTFTVEENLYYQLNERIPVILKRKFSANHPLWKDDEYETALLSDFTIVFKNQ